ncbi:plasminogen activator inhibitor 1 RNA-binding protein-like [Cimex lectularius]|uniref:Hyaluronan/mRNA-binding protein domain-containing protein n=1 Tax=Cimex lectularius TaxID=79782 RepID=A0A8I6RCH8_CIMLE|nr:plasminogen activator inhibitor 1 RNA-binding protein-like [Cimex lectularius]
MSTTQYGIRVTNNRFELSDLDDEDPLEILKMREKELEARKKTKLAEKENKSKEATHVKPNKPVNKNVKQNHSNADNHKGKEDAFTKPQGERSERKFTGENRSDERANTGRNNYEERQTDLNNKDEKNDRFEKKDNRSDWTNSGGDGGFETKQRSGRGGRGGGSTFVRGGRGRPGPRQNFDPSKGKRDFDRQSGSEKTGIKSTDKKDGGGSRNWGNPKEDLEESTNPTTTGAEDDEWNPLGWEKQVEETNTKNTAETAEEVTTTPVIEEQPETRELTLDEWKALKGPRQTPSFNIRKAGEGEDLSQWKKMYALRKKKEGEEEEDDDEYEFDSSEYPQRVGRQKHVLDIDIHFKDMRGPIRGRGGRSTRGSNRQYQGNSLHNASHDLVPKIAPKVDDEHDFPSLR